MSSQSPFYTVRHAEERDIPVLLRLLEQISRLHHAGRPDLFHVGTKYTADELRSLLCDAAYVVLVAAPDGGEAVGYALCELQEAVHGHVLVPHRTLYLDDLCVDASHRGRGVGRCLMEAVKEVARQEGCYHLTLNVWACNPQAEAFYRRHGLLPQKTCMEWVVPASSEGGF